MAVSATIFSALRCVWGSTQRRYFAALVFGISLQGISPVAANSEIEIGRDDAFIPVETTRDHSHDGRQKFLKEMPATIRADHPAIVPVADAIRAVSSDPLEQIVMVNDVTHLLVDYDDDLRVYGQVEYHATLDEMIARRRQEGWLYLRDDCDGRAVFAAHLLAALGIPWHLEASYWKGHAWVTARVKGVEYDLLDLRGKTPETSRVSYRFLGRFVTRPSHPPPFFDWRRAWLKRTHADMATGMRLGLLEIDSTPGHLHERFSTDWVKVAPNAKVSPFDQRLLTASTAAFPLGEPLKPDTGAWAKVQAPTPPADSPAAVLAQPSAALRNR